MYYTYVIQSEKDGRFYTGFTKDLRHRLNEHNSGKVTSTKNRGPFSLVYYEACLNEQDATAREKYLKDRHGKALSKKQTKAVPISNGVNVA